MDKQYSNLELRTHLRDYGSLPPAESITDPAIRRLAQAVQNAHTMRQKAIGVLASVVTRPDISPGSAYKVGSNSWLRSTLASRGGLGAAHFVAGPIDPGEIDDKVVAEAMRKYNSKSKAYESAWDALHRALR